MLHSFLHDFNRRRGRWSHLSLACNRVAKALAWDLRYMGLISLGLKAWEIVSCTTLIWSRAAQLAACEPHPSSERLNCGWVEGRLSSLQEDLSESSLQGQIWKLKLQRNKHYIVIFNFGWSNFQYTVYKKWKKMSFLTHILALKSSILFILNRDNFLTQQNIKSVFVSFHICVKWGAYLQ